jgi:hypothetical protein
MLRVTPNVGSFRTTVFDEIRKTDRPVYGVMARPSSAEWRSIQSMNRFRNQPTLRSFRRIVRSRIGTSRLYLIRDRRATPAGSILQD